MKKRKTSRPSRWRPPWRWPRESWIWLLLGAGLLWRIVRYAVVFPLWGDEAFMAMSFFSRDWLGMLEPLEYRMIAPTGYLWTNLAIAQVLGRSEWALRLLPWLAGTIAFIVFWKMSRHCLGRHAALAAIALLAASYYPVRHAAEVKPFSFDLLFSMPVLWLGWKVWCEPGRRALWVWLTLLMVVSPWFSHPSIFVSGGVLLALGGAAMARRQRRELFTWFVSGFCTSVAFAIMYWLVSSKHQWGEETIGTGTMWAAHFPPLSEPWRLPGWLLYEHTGNMFAYPNGGRNYGSSFTTFLVICGSVSLWRRGRKGLVLILLGALPMMFIAAALHLYPYGGSARTNQHLAGPICLLAGAGVPAFLRLFLTARRALVTQRIAMALLAVLILGHTARDLFVPYKTEEDVQNRDLVRELTEETGPRDLWIAYGGYEVNPNAPGGAVRMRYYLELLAPVPLIWHPDPDTLEAEREGAVRLILYRPPRKEVPAGFPEEELAAYRNAVIARLGSPRTTRLVSFGDGTQMESAEILRFGNQENQGQPPSFPDR